MAESTVDFIYKKEATIMKEFVLPPLNDYVPDSLELVSLCHKKGSEYEVILP